MKKSKIMSVVFAALVLTLLLSFSGCGKKQEETSNAENVTEENTQGNENSQNSENNDDNAAAEEKDNSSKQAQNDAVNETQEEEKKVYTPTFMYFVSNSDKDFQKTNEVIEKLKKEYGDRVNFDVRNVDKDPSLLENFELVKGQTPALIMLNTSNDISNFLFQNGNYDDLKSAIEDALK